MIKRGMLICGTFKILQEKGNPELVKGTVGHKEGKFGV